MIKLTADDGAEGDWFGNTVSLSGDTVVVGALNADVGANDDQGAAYVFYRDWGGADAWGQVKKLSADDGAASDSFGRSVSIDGDTVVVGAHYAAGGSGTRQGAAYVFYRDQGGIDVWGRVIKLTAADGAAYDWFGYSISLSGDIVVIGAPSVNIGSAFSQGAAYVFYRDQGGADAWGQVKKLTAADGRKGDWFGTAVSLSGDTFVVGAPEADVAGKSDQGAAYVFYRDLSGADAWGQAAKLTAVDGAAGDYFGNAVSVSGDRLIVGAPFADGRWDYQGATYIYRPPQLYNTYLPIVMCNY